MRCFVVSEARGAARHLRRRADVEGDRRRLDVVVVADRHGAEGPEPAQIAYWESVFRRLVQTDDWKKKVAEKPLGEYVSSRCRGAQASRSGYVDTKAF